MKKYVAFVSISLLIAATLSIVSCAAKKGKNDKLEIIKVKKGYMFEVKLKSNPTTGYSWMLSEPVDSTIIEFDKKEFVSDNDPSNPMIGAGGTEIWIFSGVDVGKTNIKLKYARNWEDEENVKTKEYIVKVSK